MTNKNQHLCSCESFPEPYPIRRPGDLYSVVRYNTTPFRFLISHKKMEVGRYLTKGSCFLFSFVLIYHLTYYILLSLSLSLSPQFSYIVWKNCILAYLLGNHLTIISLHSFWLSRVPEALMTLSWASDTFPTLLNTNFSPFLFWYLTFLFDKNLLT